MFDASVRLSTWAGVIERFVREVNWTGFWSWRADWGSNWLNCLGRITHQIHLWHGRQRSRIRWFIWRKGVDHFKLFSPTSNQPRVWLAIRIQINQGNSQAPVHKVQAFYENVPFWKTNHTVVSVMCQKYSVYKIQERWVLSKNLTCQYNSSIFQIQASRFPYALRRMMMIIRECYGGTITI